jgi:hypothetical protein
VTKREAAILGAYTGILFGEFRDMHAYVEEKLKRSVFTHEFGDKVTVALIKDECHSDFMAICNNLT